jgi:Fe-Mn family superoxide dismutase
MAYEVPPLPYDYDALEPHIDEQTMRIHHDKHHQAYVDKANAALEGTDWDGKPIEEVLQNLDALPSDKQTPVRNQGGGHYNHTLFWESMKPNGGGEPSGALADAINSAFGSFDELKDKMNATGAAQFGSGWAWLVHDGSGVLPEVPEQAPRLPPGLVEHRGLGQGRRALRRRVLTATPVRPRRCNVSDE